MVMCNEHNHQIGSKTCSTADLSKCVKWIQEVSKHPKFKPKLVMIDNVPPAHVDETGAPLSTFLEMLVQAFAPHLVDTTCIRQDK